MTFIIKATSPNNKQHKQRVYIALETMQQHGLATGDVIILRKGSDQIAVGVAWPSLTTQVNDIELNTQTRLGANWMIGDTLDACTKIPCYSEAACIQLTTTADRTYLKEYLIQYHTFIVQDQVIDFEYLGTLHRTQLHIIASYPSDVYRVSTSTKLLTETSAPQPVKSCRVKTGYAAIGGLEKQIKTIRDMIEPPLHNPSLFTNYGLKPPRGVLLYGPPGTGKTLIARAVATETNAHVIFLNGSDILSKFYGETEQKLRDIFAEAVQHAPSIIFMDEIDALCPKRDEAPSELEKRVVTTLLTLMDGKDSCERVVVIGATNRPNTLDEALRRPGRFDREVEIGIPSAASRQSIFSTILQSMPHCLTLEQVQELANKSHGYVGADIAAVCREAGLKCIKRVTHSNEPLLLSYQDMTQGMQEIRPSAMREILLEVPKVYWSDVGGQDDIKQRLKESVEWPLQHPEAFTRLGIRPPKGILLYGPPGCSKTLMAKALATEAGSNFIAVKGPELFSKWVGESEKAVREVFKKARAASPSIVFFDEIDALTVKRGSGDGSSSVADRVLSQLLNELDGVEALVNVTVVAATNRPDIIDDALLRPGRIDRILYVGPPNLESRREIFKIQTSKMAIAGDVDLDQVAVQSEGCSGAEAVAICQEAALFAMEEDLHIENVAMRHFERALKSFTRRITPQMIQFYKDFQQKSGLQSV